MLTSRPRRLLHEQRTPRPPPRRRAADAQRAVPAAHTEECSDGGSRADLGDAEDRGDGAAKGADGRRRRAANADARPPRTTEAAPLTLVASRARGAATRTAASPRAPCTFRLRRPAVVVAASASSSGLWKTRLRFRLKVFDPPLRRPQLTAAVPPRRPPPPPLPSPRLRRERRSPHSRQRRRRFPWRRRSCTPVDAVTSVVRGRPVARRLTCRRREFAAAAGAQDGRHELHGSRDRAAGGRTHLEMERASSRLVTRIAVAGRRWRRIGSSGEQTSPPPGSRHGHSRTRDASGGVEVQRAPSAGCRPYRSRATLTLEPKLTCCTVAAAPSTPPSSRLGAGPPARRE